MEGSWNNGKPYYRCQIDRDDPIDRARHPPRIYLKEEALLPQVDEWLVSNRRPSSPSMTSSR
jgi:site-specific DNA recombinase